MNRLTAWPTKNIQHEDLSNQATHLIYFPMSQGRFMLIRTFNRVVPGMLAALTLCAITGCAPAVTGRSFVQTPSVNVAFPHQPGEQFLVGFVPKPSLDPEHACSEQPSTSKEPDDVYAAILCDHTKPVSYAYVIDSGNKADFKASTATDKRLEQIAEQESISTPPPLSMP